MNSVTLEFTTYWFSDAMMPTNFGFSNITISIIYTLGDTVMSIIFEFDDIIITKAILYTSKILWITEFEWNLYFLIR